MVGIKKAYLKLKAKSAGNYRNGRCNFHDKTFITEHSKRDKENRVNSFWNVEIGKRRRRKEKKKKQVAYHTIL